MLLLKTQTKLWLGVSGVFAAICDLTATLLYELSFKNEKKPMKPPQKTHPILILHEISTKTICIQSEHLLRISTENSYRKIWQNFFSFPLGTQKPNWLITTSRFYLNKYPTFLTCTNHHKTKEWWFCVRWRQDTGKRTRQAGLISNPHYPQVRVHTDPLLFSSTSKLIRQKRTTKNPCLQWMSDNPVQ